jgi:cell division protein FtsI/penicillin-binding protein 2
MTKGMWLVACGMCAGLACAQPAAYNPQTSYLVLDAHSGAVISEKWEDAEHPVPFGSLVKPFTALAFAQTHGFQYPEYECRGESAGCWYPRGHGRIGITGAISHSCNAYFLMLAGKTRIEDVTSLALRFGMSGPGPGSPASTLVGLGEGWEASPIQIARAYCELAARRGEPGVDELLTGMALSATVGTGSAAGVDALVKTGTAPCVHSRKMPGDGYTIALYPRGSPRIAVLVRVHGVPGSQAAITAGRMLRACNYNR